ncbi:unnamed protein product [Spirodela intermedia]|uniref:Uncharacterized protein n=1 Tax=Spirodela intermedia TaxID=51605 RepID=A0A7I8LM51_SPIIN|nr:unnamed protein product [Spirodela intermedia]
MSLACPWTVWNPPGSRAFSAQRLSLPFYCESLSPSLSLSLSVLPRRLSVAKDPIFSRDGADMYVDSNISFTQIPKGVQPGQLLVLRGRVGHTSPYAPDKLLCFVLLLSPWSNH